MTHGKGDTQIFLLIRSIEVDDHSTIARIPIQAKHTDAISVVETLFNRLNFIIDMSLNGPV